MCGLAGEIRSSSRPPDVDAVAVMTRALEARGPDGQGTWHDDRVALGHRRLAIIDLTDRGAQPMVDEDGPTAVVFNGCIYNHRELRAELEADGHRFRSTSDTEVILAGYRRWGADVVHHLQGMFAFCVRDGRRGRTLLARDRLGIKPLYLAERGDRLRFASTLPALLAAGGVDTDIDPTALHAYLTFHSVVPAPATVLAGVRRLPAATVLILDDDGRRHEYRWWEPRFERSETRDAWTPGDWQDAVLEALRTAVERRLVADVPVGVLLSGGVDSSLVVALLAEQGHAGLSTFSIGFDDAGGVEGNEFRWSDLVAARYGTDHHRLPVAGERLRSALPATIAAMSEPMVSHDVVAFHLLSEEVSRHVKVVQSGQGADEIFAGYRWYPEVAAGAGVGGDALGVEAYARAFFDRDHAGVAELVSPEHRCSADPSRRAVEEHFARPGAATAVDRALRLDTEVMLCDDPVKRVDTMTMAFGLEARVPFLDHELVELAAACPPELKLDQGGKGPLKSIARRLLPAEVIDRPKGYFPVPALTHLDGGTLRAVAEALRAPEARERNLFRPEAVDRLVAAPNDELTPLGGNQLWQLGLLELWLQHHVDGVDIADRMAEPERLGSPV